MPRQICRENFTTGERKSWSQYNNEQECTANGGKKRRRERERERERVREKERRERGQGREGGRERERERDFKVRCIQIIIYH